MDLIRTSPWKTQLLKQIYHNVDNLNRDISNVKGLSRGYTQGGGVGDGLYTVV